MIPSGLLDEINFICERALWLRKQPCDSEGTLLCEDYRDEAGLLLRRVEELERAYASL